MQVEITIPDEMAPYADDIKFFATLMVRKLHTNRHKGTGHMIDLKMALAMCRSEILEAEEALMEQGQFEVAVECADIANFAFLTARSALNMTREDFIDQKSLNIIGEKSSGD